MTRWLAGASAVAVAGSVAPSISHAQTQLYWDPLATTQGSDGSGTWDAGNVANPIWTDGATDQPWNNSGNVGALFGNLGTTPGANYVVTLATNINVAGISIGNAGSGTYTFNGSGHTLSSPAGDVDIDAIPVTLTNGTFAVGNATDGNSVLVSDNAVLTVGPAAVLSTTQIAAASTGGTVRFDGSTFQPLSNLNISTGVYFQLTGTTNTYLAAGGLTVDTSVLAAQSSSGTLFDAAFFEDPLQHDPSLAAGTADGGLTISGGSFLYDGFLAADPTNNINLVNTYTGTTTLKGSNTDLRIETSGNATTTGPFPNTRFVVNAGAELDVLVNDGLAGATGTTPVTLVSNSSSGAYLVTGSTSLVHLYNVTSTGGVLTSYTTNNGSGGTFSLRGDLHAVTATGVTQTSIEPGSFAANVGSDLRADNGASIIIYCPIVDESAAVPTQLTLNSSSTGLIYSGAADTFTGTVAINGGTFQLGTLTNTNTTTGVVTVVSVGNIMSSKTITIATGATLLDGGMITSLANIQDNGTFTYRRGAFATFTGPEITTIGSLNVGTGTVAGLTTLNAATSVANRLVLVTGALTLAGTTNAWVGKVNLNNNDLIVQNGNLATLANQVKQGYNNGAWNGTGGIYSATAAADAKKLTAVGVIVNNDGAGNPLYGSGTTLGTFSTLSPGTADVLLRYTYYGDANLDGKVNGADYVRIDAGYAAAKTATPLTGWYNGDFNYDGKVDGSDYTLIDNAFNLQGASLSPSGLATPIGDDNNSLPAPTLPRIVEGDPSQTPSYVSELGGSGLTASATAEIAAVPEPATLSVFALAGTAALLRRRRTA